MTAGLSNSRSDLINCLSFEMYSLRPLQLCGAARLGLGCYSQEAQDSPLAFGIDLMTFSLRYSE
jgi:hypothetical protein